MAQQNGCRRYALGLGRANIVFGENIKHRRAGDAADEGEIGKSQCDRRKDEPLQPGSDAVGQIGVALHRHHPQVECKDIDQKVADNKARHRKSDHRHHHQQPVNECSRLGCRSDANNDGEWDDDSKGDQGQRERRLQPFGDQRQHGCAGENRNAEVSLQHVERPPRELNRQWIVQPEVLPDCSDLFSGGRCRLQGRQRDHPAPSSGS